MTLLPRFHYRRHGDFTYHVLTGPDVIKSHLLKWMLREWELDHSEAPEEHWTVEWMKVLPLMQFKLEVVRLDDIQPHPDLWKAAEFQSELKERAEDREGSFLRGVSIEPLLINYTGFQLMDGYTRYVLLKRYNQKDVLAYIGRINAAADGSMSQKQP